jgi:hypothetical protein
MSLTRTGEIQRSLRSRRTSIVTHSCASNLEAAEKYDSSKESGRNRDAPMQARIIQIWSTAASPPDERSEIFLLLLCIPKIWSPIFLEINRRTRFMGKADSERV